MKAFDTDILTLVLQGNLSYLGRFAAMPLDHQTVPIVVAEEILRGRLGVVRQAEGGKSRVSIDRAYALFEETLAAFRPLRFLPFTDAAELQFKEWRRLKIRGSTRDLRIPACCVTNHATLVTRNRRDFENIPGLSAEFWD